MVKRQYNKVPLDVSLHLRYLHQDLGLKGAKLLERYPQYSRRIIFYHAKKSIGQLTEDKRKRNPGRPSKLSPEQRRELVSQIVELRQRYGVFSSRHIQRAAGISETDVSNRTVRRSLNRSQYRYLQCRKKGQVTTSDEEKRLKFAQQVKKIQCDKFWETGISFYLDGTSFVHKNNPCEHARTQRTRTWRRKDEGLSLNCTAKGRKEGNGGQTAKFLVAIAHGKGVIGCHRYEGQINGAMFAKYVTENFEGLFGKSANVKGRLFLQDGDPSQNSAVAEAAWKSVGCRVFHIPPRSPDLNPIENVFHSVKQELHSDALTMRIEKESFRQFCSRVKRKLMQFSHEHIDKTISSMPKRIDMVIAGKGKRTKY